MSSDLAGSEYPVVPLTNVLDIQGGAQPPASTFKARPEPGYVRFVQIRDFETDAHLTFIRQEARWRYCSASDVLIARYGASVGRICRGVSGAYNVALAKVVPKGVDLGFLYYLLKSEYFQGPIAAMSGRSAQAGFNKSDLTAIHVPIPPQATQLAVASMLQSLDDRIALLRETNTTLEAIAQALFKSWFVDFDPVRAKSQGLAPAGIDDATAALFPDEYEESTVGLVPKGWHQGTLANLADLNSQSWSARHHPERIRYLDLANVKDNEVAAIAEFAFDEAPSRARRVLRSGDTIVGTVRPGNRSFAFIYEPLPDLTASTGFAVLSPKAVDNTAFVYLAATQDASIEHLSHVADGGAYPAVRPDAVLNLACVVPTADILRTFDTLARPLLEKVSANYAQGQSLATLRDTLLPRLISGQLRMPEAQAQIEEALA